MRRSRLPPRPHLGSDLSVYGSDVESRPDARPLAWSDHPRTLTVGLATVIYFLYAVFNDNKTDDSTVYNTQRGIKYACIFFLIFCALQLRDGHFVRPHPAVWRIVTGVFVLYEMFLVVLLFQNTDDARKMLRYLDPSLGVELAERGYAEDCRIFTFDHPESWFKNVKDTVLDEFVIMHFVGWFVGALLMRSYIVCWFISIMFEAYELTFKHWLPNFNECWWDHVFLDVLICNAAGIYLGMRVCHYLEMKNYNWVGLNEIPKLSGKAWRAIAQFFPESWLHYEWEMFRSAHRFWRVLFMIIAWSVMLLNSFFLKTVLWLPPVNPLNGYRLIIWFSAGSYAVAEYYIFCTAPGVTKLGPRAWLGVGVVITEVCIIVKHGTGYFEKPFPFLVKLIWGIVAGVVLFGSTIYFSYYKGYVMGQLHRQQQRRRSNGNAEPVESTDDEHENALLSRRFHPNSHNGSSGNGSGSGSGSGNGNGNGNGNGRTERVDRHASRSACFSSEEGQDLNEFISAASPLPSRVNRRRSSSRRRRTTKPNDDRGQQ